MTGLAPDATGVYELQKHFRSSVPDVVTLGQAFQKNGYFVAQGRKDLPLRQPGPDRDDGLDDAPDLEPAGKSGRRGQNAEEPLLTNYTPDRGLGSSCLLLRVAGKR